MRKSQEHGSILTHVKFIQQKPRKTMYKDPDQYISRIFEYPLLNWFKPESETSQKTSDSTRLDSTRLDLDLNRLGSTRHVP